MTKETIVMLQLQKNDNNIEIKIIIWMNFCCVFHSRLHVKKMCQ